jgi:AcrR family transcriptional regulator
MVGRPELTLTGIIEATLALARKIGFDAVSLRPLAAELNVTPTALYYHVRNKEELLDAVVAKIFAPIATPAASLAWTDRMRSLILEHNELLQTYPGLARFLISRSQNPVVRQRMSAIHEVLRDGGFHGDQLEAAFAIFAFYSDPATMTAALPEGETEFVVDVEGLPSRSASAFYRLGLESLLASFDRELERNALDEPARAIGAPPPQGLKKTVESSISGPSI